MADDEPMCTMPGHKITLLSQKELEDMSWDQINERFGFDWVCRFQRGLQNERYAWVNKINAMYCDGARLAYEEETSDNEKEKDTGESVEQPDKKKAKIREDDKEVKN